jgi:hypothetical protein
MPWTCRLIPAPQTEADYAAVRVGDMWYVDPEVCILAPEHEGKRPIVVCMPGPMNFMIHSAEARSRAGWTVTGEPPAITMTPSIHTPGVYHGYLTAGVITDDLDGRRYTDAGAVIRTGR